jgi:hypothetical protein
VQLQAVSRSLMCVQSGRWYSFVIVITACAPFDQRFDNDSQVVMLNVCPYFASGVGGSGCARAT